MITFSFLCMFIMLLLICVRCFINKEVDKIIIVYALLSSIDNISIRLLHFKDKNVCYKGSVKTKVYCD